MEASFFRQKRVLIIETKLLHRMDDHARDWGVVIENSLETESSLIALGSRHNQPIVLKVIKRMGDEWNSGEILKAFDGKGVVHVYEYAPGAVLMQRLRPGDSLADMVLKGCDEEATDILADVIQQMGTVKLEMSMRELPTAKASARSQQAKLTKFATIQDWAKGFDRYLATRNDQIPIHLFEAAHRLYSELCASQREPRLLHGDLHHYNVLFDSERGWLAIDPKGVIGEPEYELGAVLRNPFELPDLFATRATIERRLKQFTRKLNLDLERSLAWAFAQAVLSAIWDIEDGFTVDATSPALRLAHVIGPMLGVAG
jgi:streptomycin 6-kinase